MTAVNLATADLFHAEIARLHAEIDRLRSQPCPYVTGNVTRYCTLTPLTLTDAEREAVDTAEASLMRESTDLNTPLPVRQRLGAAAATLQRLLKRLG